MGCNQSKGGRRESLRSRRNTLIVKPIVNLNVGEGINLTDPCGTKIIFLFGGPGSGKGTVVNNLIDMYNFRFICGEDLILESLSQKLLKEYSLKGTAATQELQKHIQEDSSMLTLHWVLELIKEEILKHSGEIILVDIMPNLKFLLRVPTFVKNCVKEMKCFEENLPVTFAINLALDQDHLISNINQTHVCTKAPTSGQTEDKGSSDEMDTSRTQRRFNIYSNSVKEFLTYFEHDKKLLTVDASCGDINAVWESIRDYIVMSDIAKPSQGIEQVILLKMSEKDFQNIDRNRYPMLQINCKDLLEDYATASPDKLFKKIVLQLRLHAVEWKTFLVDCVGTSLCCQEKYSKVTNHELMFMEMNVGQLDYFMHGIHRRTERKKSLARKEAQLFLSVTTSDNETLLFCNHSNRAFCHRIGLEYLHAR